MPITKPINADFGDDANKSLENYVWNQITSLKQALNALHTEKVVKWNRLYKGVPKENPRNFPWKNASNVVIQLIGENVDIIRARVLGTVFEVMPLWVTGLLGDWKKEEAGGEQQEATHEFLNYVGLEPKELDLYRVESVGVTECIKYGTVAYKFPWVTEVEAEAVGQVEGENKVAFRELVKYDGPRPEKIDFTKWAATLSAHSLEDATFKFHIISLTKQQMEERKFKGVYKLTEEEWTKLLASPTRPGNTDAQKKRQQEGNAQTPDGYENAEWDVYECWFPYFHNGHKYRLIYSFNYEQRIVMRSIFNFYPKHEEPWELARFGYTEDELYGMGLCELLEHYQEEVSTGHNQRVDNRTLANTSILRVDPNSKLDSIFSIYPNALVPANEGEIEKIQLGSNYPSSVEEERLTIELAKARVGTGDPGIQAQGGGAVGKKGYSAMGTFSILQAGNRRTNVNITDMRYTHLKLGRKFLNQYSEFGIGERLKLFGEKAKYLEKAFENIKAGRLVLPIKAATASINKELEKQNDLLLTQVLQRHHLSISQIMQAVNNPMLPKEVKEYLVGVIDSSSIVMGRILRNFGHEDLSRLLPERKIVEGASSGQSTSQGPAGGTQQGAGGADAVEQNSGQESGPIPQLSPQAGIPNAGGVPPRVI